MTQHEKKIYEKGEIRKSAKLMEKILNQIELKKKYLNYRNYPDPR